MGGCLWRGKTTVLQPRMGWLFPSGLAEMSQISLILTDIDVSPQRSTFSGFKHSPDLVKTCWKVAVNPKHLIASPVCAHVQACVLG